MPELNFDRHVPYSPAQMLALVADLGAYPSFVPNCSDMQVKTDHGQPGDVRLARMSVYFGPIAQAYTSRVVIDPDACTVTARAVDGPFSHLQSRWSFIPEGEGSLVNFTLDFGFSNPLIAAAAGKVFAAKQEEIVDAFMKEAKRRYG